MNEPTTPRTNGNGNFDSTSHNYDEGAPPAVRARELVNSNRNLSPGAKWFYGWLTDNSYLRSRGGDEHGRITIGVRDIRHLTGHDKKSITKWTKELYPSVWVEHEKIPNAYPVNRYCIRALVPGGEQLRLQGLSQVWGRVRGEQGKFSPPSFLGSEAQSPSQAPDSTPPVTQDLPLARPLSSASEAPSSHLARPVSSTCEADKRGLGGGENGSGEADKRGLGGGQNGSGEGAGTVRFKETPTEKRRQGDKGGAAPPPESALEDQFRDWERNVLADANNSTLKKFDALFAGQLQTVRNEAARELVKRKLAAVRLRLFGPSLPDKSATVKPTRTSTATTQRLTAAQRDELAKKIGPALRAAVEGRA
jgi:hypothetical protein